MNRLWIGLALLATIAAPAEAQQTRGSSRGPDSGIVLETQAGDTACYVRVRDEAGRTRSWMAGFEVCEANLRAGRRYRFTWETGNVLHPDCQGNMDCGRSLRVWLISRARPESN